MAQIEGRNICWGGEDMMVANGTDKKTDSGATEKMRGVQRGWK